MTGKAHAPGSVFLVSTPIGNLKDITYRAVEVLKTVPLIAAEDTRQTRKLLDRYRISTSLISYYEHNRYNRIPQILNHLEAGNDIAVVTDAGTPGISDPAYRLIREAIQHEIRIISIPGPTAAVSSLTTSGLPTDRFLFEGFLPPKKGRKKRLTALKDVEGTIVFFENPRRIPRTLKDILEYIGDRPAVVCRELTKIHEEVTRGTVQELHTYYQQHPPKGECVILIGKDDPHVYFQ